MATYWDLYYLSLSDCLLYNVHVRSWKSSFLCAVKTALSLLMIVCFDRIGGERVLLLATTSWASITACTPLLAQLGISSLTSMTVARFLMGLLQGERVETEKVSTLCLLFWNGLVTLITAAFSQVSTTLLWPVFVPNEWMKGKEAF